MHTIRLRVDERIYRNLMWFLNRFSKDELQVIREDDEYLSVREYLKKELAAVEEGTDEYISLEELDKELDATLEKYED